MTDLGRHGRNMSWLVLADVFNKAVSLVFFAYLSRRITVTENGWYGTFIALSFILLTVNTLGFNDVLIREGAKDRNRIHGLISVSLLLTGAVFAVVTPGVWYATGLLGYGPELRVVAVLASASATLAAAITLHVGVVAAHERFMYSSMVEMAVRAGNVAAAMLLLYRGYGVMAVLACYVAFQAVHVAAVAAVARRTCLAYRFAPSLPDLRYLLRQSIPFAVGRISGTAAVNLDVPLLNSLAPGAAGFYSIATRFFHLLSSFAYALESVMYPVLSRRALTDAAAQRFAFGRFVRVSLWAALPMAVGMTVLWEPVIALLAGPKFLPGGPATAVLAWVLALSMVERTGAIYLRARSLQEWPMYVNLAVFLVKLVLSLAVVPTYGVPGLLVVNVAVGCGWTAATLGATGAALPGLAMGRLLVREAWRPALAAAAMGLVLLPLRALPAPVSVAIGAGVYGVGMILLGGLDDFDRRLLRQTLPRWGRLRQ